jgi:hypothetical protein
LERVAVRIIKTKEQLLGISQEEENVPLYNDEYNIVTMLKQNNQDDTDDVINMITFCTDNPELAQKLRALCVKYRSIFRTDLNPEPAKVPPMEIEVNTNLWRHDRNRGPPRAQGVAKEKEIYKQIQEMLKRGIIRESTASEYSQVTLTPKPNGEWRFCIDYRQLNNATTSRTWPLPNPKLMLRRLGDHRPRRFAKLDYVKGYFQTLLAEASRVFSAFIVFCGIYEWIRVPMGAKGSPSYFQFVMSTIVLAGLIYIICELYIDDILVHAQTDDDLLVRLELIFQRMVQFNVSLNPKKCILGFQEVEYVGHVINSEGLRMSDEKIKKIIDFQLPTRGRELKSFLGLANYFRDHIGNYSSMTKPLFDMIKNYSRQKKLHHTDETIAAFEQIKRAISFCPQLFFLDDTSPLYLHTDASNYAIGAYLFQVRDDKEYPIAFLSQLLNSTQIRWSTYEKEAYAIYYAFTNWAYLIKDRHFVLRTDHKNLTHIKSTGSDKVIRWKLAIQEFDFVVEHIQGTHNVVADDLSRLVVPQEVWDREHIPSDSEDEDQPNASQVDKHPLLLIRRRTVTIPEYIYKAISAVHNSTIGHHGVERTIAKLVKKNIQFEFMRAYVKAFIRQCPCCQAISQIKPIIHTLPFTTSGRTPMTQLNMDTVGPMPKVMGYEYILVVVDCFTRFVELFPLQTTLAEEAARAILTHVGRYGCPEEIITDGGHEYANKLMTELTTLMGAQHIITTPYSKEENAIVERVNKEIIKFLQQITYDRVVQDKWVTYLPLVQRIINTSVNESIGVAPAQLLFANQIDLDRNILTPFPQTEDKQLSTYVEELMDVQVLLMGRALQYQNAKDQRHLMSRNDPPTEFPINSYVLVQYPNSRMGRKAPTKLHTPWRGPYRVVNKIGHKYTVQDLVTKTEEDVHVTSLKPFYYDPNIVNPLEIARKHKQGRLIETVLQHRGNTRRRHTLEFLVRYVGDLPPNEKEKWELYWDIRHDGILHEYLRANRMKTLIPKKFKDDE